MVVVIVIGVRTALVSGLISQPQYIIRIHIKDPNKDPRFLNQVPTLHLSAQGGGCSKGASGVQRLQVRV